MEKYIVSLGYQNCSSKDGSVLEQVYTELIEFDNEEEAREEFVKRDLPLAGTEWYNGEIKRLAHHEGRDEEELYGNLTELD